jgi:hypothetical protein
MERCGLPWDDLGWSRGSMASTLPSHQVLVEKLEKEMAKGQDGARLQQPPSPQFLTRLHGAGLLLSAISEARRLHPGQAPPAIWRLS